MPRLRRTRRCGAFAVLATTVAAALVLSGCSGDSPRMVTAPPPADVDVAAPEMVQAKQQGGVEECPAPQTEGGALPAVTLDCLGGGRAVDLSTLEGPLVINFFQAACEPCRLEMPALQEFHRKYGDRVALLGIDSNDTYPGVALDEAISRGVTYPMVADPGGDLQKTKLRITGYPQFWILDEEGELHFHSGGLTSLDQVVDMVEDAGITL
ncbi:TlpA family protein disulfide reductase [Nocardioides insulae]|uniref:TlpA family protein disulfide reductase n=1 Tax=Nocardioides insulae TaxID=394734 RepID=UPI000404C609|nr:TlpA disulfide reductase family protein [Nocardioides insulae]